MKWSLMKFSEKRNRPLFAACLITIILCSTSCTSSDFIAVYFPNGRSVTCEIADSPKKLTAGLSTYNSLPPDHGMIFVYPRERTNVSFWMPQRMKFSLDMIFLNNDKEIVYMAKEAPPCSSNLPEDCPSYGPGNKPTRYVVEVVAGFCDSEKLKIGDQLNFNLP